MEPSVLESRIRRRGGGLRIGGVLDFGDKSAARNRALPNSAIRCETCRGIGAVPFMGFCPLAWAPVGAMNLVMAWFAACAKTPLSV